MVEIKKIRYSFAIGISLFWLCLTSCISSSEISTTPTIINVKATGTPTASIVVPIVTLSTETLTLPPSNSMRLPTVTLSPQQAKAGLQKLLKTNGNCTGKCVGGIRPDEMTVQDAVDQMAQWSILEIGENTLGKTFITNMNLSPLDTEVSADLTIETLTKNSTIIDKVSFHMPSLSSSEEFVAKDMWLVNRDAWNAFQLDNLLKAYGTPSYVGFFLETRHPESIAYTIEIQYQQLNLAIGIGALGDKDGKFFTLCPSLDPHNLGITINFERPLTEVQQFYPVTWQALTGTDLDLFYRKFTDENNLDTCIATTFEEIEALDPTFR